MSKNKDLQDAREKFFDGPASDYQSFYQFLMQQGRPDLVDLDTEDRTKKSTGGRVKMAGGTKKPKKQESKQIQGVIHISGSDILNPDFDAEKLVGNLTRTILEEEKSKRDKKSTGGRVKLSKGSPNPALMDATSNRVTNGKISRGGGAALRGLNFKGVF